MKRDTVIATVIMEESMEPSKPLNLNVTDTPNQFYVNFVTVLQEFNAQNRNRRTYNKEPMWESLHLPHIQELMRKNTWYGESGHPMSDDTKRILTIDPKLTCHNIKRIWLQGNLLYGEIETLDDGMYGTQFTKNILQGQEPAFSLRALAQLVKCADGSSIVRTKSHVVTYDRVILPSHEKAYRDENIAVKKIYKNVALEGNSIYGDERLVPVHEASLTDYIMEESTNVHIMSDIMDVCKENVTFTKDLKNLIIKEGNETYFVDVEEKIKRDVMHCLAHL